MADYSQKVRDIRRRFLESLDARVGDIDSVLRQVETGAPGAADELHLRLHDLSGNAAMLGFDGMAREARRGLDAIDNGYGEASGNSPEATAIVRSSIARIRELKTEGETSE
ncbi:Hpt domain-containing protein [Roseivivax sp.]